MLTDKRLPSNKQPAQKTMLSVAPDQPASQGDALASSDTLTETASASKEPDLTEVSVPVSPTSNPPFEDVFKRLGGLRDGLLVSGGVVYVLGRTVWAYQSQRFNQGIISVDQSQYFVAGFVPAVILALVWFGVRGIRSFLEVVARWYVPSASLRKRILRKVLAYCYIAADLFCGCLWAGNYLWTHRHFFPQTSFLYTVLLITFSCIFMTGLPLLLRVRGNQGVEKMQFDYSDRVIMGVYPVIVGIISIVFYGGLVYPQLPQEYGGARPRVAYLDLDRSKLSPDTLEELSPSSAIQLKNATVRTVLLDVFFASKDTLLVKPYRRWHDNRTYEIPGSSVLGRTWADPAKLRP